MTALPIPQRLSSDAVLRPLDDRTLRVGGAFAADCVAAASDLSAKAFGLSIVLDASAADVLVIAEDDGGSPADGVDPRPADRTGASEAYRIAPHEGRLRVVVSSAEGLFRALLVIAASATDGLPALRVEDRPERSWRGLSLDVVRRWFSAGEVRRIIDLLALHRLNVLHLHLTDTQAWRFAVPGYPSVAATEHYDATELSALEDYARDRFVVIVPEIDVPGHVPESVTGLGDVTVETGAHPILSYLDAGAPGVEPFLSAAFGELASRFSSPWLHLGGDEAFGAPEDVYARTVAAAARLIRDLGRAPIGWQEAIRSGALGADTGLAQLWIADRDRFDAEKMKALAPVEYHPMIERAGSLFALSIQDPALIGAAGVGTIVSSSDPLYLDRQPLEASVDTGQEDARRRLGNPGYPPTPTTSVLDWQPETQPDIAEAGIRVAGIEAALWCESVESFDDAAFLLLPRLALIAQQAWGPAHRDAVLAAVRDHGDVWTRLGFGAHFRSSEIYDS